MAQQRHGRWPLRSDAQSSAWRDQTVVMVAAAGSAFALLAGTLPSGLVLPLFAALALGAGAGAALFGWWFGARQHAGRITCWDVAGTCVFVGFAAGVLSDPGHVAEILSVPRER